MASGLGSHRDSQLPNRASRPTRRYSPYPPPSGRDPLVTSGSTLVRVASEAGGPAAQTTTAAPSSWEEEQQMSARLKELTPAYEAYYNAALPTTSTKRFRCAENTRVEVLDTIWMWTHGNDDVKIYWLNGMAGTGKTTIAYTLCEMLYKNRQLGASFFCSLNSPDCRDVNRIFPTVAYQLGRYSSAYRKALCDVLKNDPDVAKRNIETQFELLIAMPLAKVDKAALIDTVVVIDALDECADVGGTKDVLELLLWYADSLPLKFFVASRPEASICASMESLTGSLRSILWLHDVEQSLVEADIKTYLAQALRSSDVPPSDIDRLAALAGCLFIFAATAVRYITLDHGGVDTHERLQNILHGHSVGGNKQYNELDSLYRTILAKVLAKEELEDCEVERRRRVLWTVVCAREPMNPATLSETLDLGNERQIRLAIQSLQSVLHLSGSAEVVSTLHASFTDFLLNRDRSGTVFCDPHDHHSYLAARCFDRMARLLRFNICDLETSYLLDKEVPCLEDRVNAAISPGLFYACRYWSDHMTKVQACYDFLPRLNGFLRHQLLFWMEVLSLKGCSSQGEAILSMVVSWLPQNNDLIELRDLVHDARSFATTFAANPCSLSTPHIYCSVLPFTSRQSRIWQAYWPRTRGLIQVGGAAMEARGMSTLAIWLSGGPVRSIAQSHDGRSIVCGTGGVRISPYFGEVSIWDISKGGSIVGPLRGHLKGVVSVAFSPNSTRIASGSTDSTIQIWGAPEGSKVAGPLYGHSQAVYSVAFSPDGVHLASGSGDRTIRIWDAHSGAPISEPLAGHEGTVFSVAFSPGGKHLVSGSSDRTIRVWDWRTRTTTQQPIQAHTGTIRSVAYSPHGFRLASGSDDCTVRVWNMASGTLHSGPFKGHTGSVSSVSFSSSGSQVVSGSHDCTVRVWDSTSGALLAGPFKGHTAEVNSVLFTVDGTRIISGSSDMTIRVWDARHRMAGAIDPSGHTSRVYTIALSPDGTRVASGSADRTISVWDARNGTLVAGPFRGHSGSVRSVAFSPDIARIVSGSDDRTLRMWDPSAGTLLTGPFEGHTGSVNSVAFSPDGGRVASGSNDRTIRIWHSRTGELISESFRSGGPVVSVAFSPDGAHIVSGFSRTVHLWDAKHNTTLWMSDAHTFVTCVAFSPDGTQVVSGSHRDILILDVSNGVVLHGPFRGHTKLIYSVAVSPDGTHVVSGSEDRTVRVWDVHSGMAVAGLLQGHADVVSFVAFSLDDARAFFGSDDGTIRVWDIEAAGKAGPAYLDNRTLREDGWVTDSCSRQRVLWVPSDLRNRFRELTPSSPIVMGARCTARVDASTLLGGRWGGCFDTSPGPVLS